MLIPAFNEERVIDRSVAPDAREPTIARLEVIVIDDGSKDAHRRRWSPRRFGDDPRVRLLTLENGGKARGAQPRRSPLPRGEIVIALDADTQFEPDDDRAGWRAGSPTRRLGAVAGNAKVGNRVNLVTNWQALEYITAQNLERRALAALGAITVVPGAVGAWRSAALDAGRRLSRPTRWPRTRT